MVDVSSDSVGWVSAGGVLGERIGDEGDGGDGTDTGARHRQ